MNPYFSATPDTGTLVHQFLQTYQPSPSDSKFVLDLLHALDNYQPLTLLQKLFIFVAILPGPLSWKISLFTYFSNPASISIFPVLASIVLFIVVVWITRVLLRNYFLRKNPSVFLDLTFPATANKSAHATEQLFTLIHSLAGQHTLIQRLVGYKKRYSLEIAATRKLGIRYILVISKSDASTIQKNLLAYMPGLKIQTISDYFDLDQANAVTCKSTVIELALKSDFALPLNEQKLLSEHDSMAYLAGNMTKLNDNELMAFQIITTPVTRSHRAIIRRINKLLRRLYRNEPLADDVLASPIQRTLNYILYIPITALKAILTFLSIVFSLVVPGWKWEPEKNSLQGSQINNPIEDQLRNGIKQKIDQSLFETSLRLFVRSNEPSERITGFLAAFAPLASAYQMFERKTGLSLIDPQPSLTRFRFRRLSWLKNPILSTSELTDIYHFPYTDTTKTEDLQKIKSPALPAPLAFKQGESGFDNVFATNSYGGSETPIGQTLEERRRHTYILGATGSGKTTLLSTMIYQDICNGKGVAVIDPHGQLVEQLLRVIPNDRMKDVVWFAPDDDSFPIGLNLLDLPHAGETTLTTSQLEKQKSLVSSSLISVFQKFYDAKFFGPRMEYVLRNAILTALETPNPTLLTILDILTKTGYRKQVVQPLQNSVLQDFWVHEFEKLGQLQRNSVVSPITNKIGGLLSSPINYATLSQPKSTIDFADIMNNGKILLCDLSKGKIGEDASSFFGSLILAKLQLAALSRAHMPETDRRDFYMYVDEFQNFATPTFGELVSEARKYHLATILAHQSISQIENRDLVKVILANVGTVICFRTANPEDEQFILPIFAPEVAKHEISNLPLYHFYMKVSVGQAQDAFMAQVNNFTVKGNDDTAQATIAASRSQYAVLQHSDGNQSTIQPISNVAPVKPVFEVIPDQKPKKRSY